MLSRAEKKLLEEDEILKTLTNTSLKKRETPLYAKFGNLISKNKEVSSLIAFVSMGLSGTTYLGGLQALAIGLVIISVFGVIGSIIAIMIRLEKE